jgi:hypothetical protein
MNKLKFIENIGKPKSPLKFSKKRGNIPFKQEHFNEDPEGDKENWGDAKLESSIRATDLAFEKI